MPFFKDKDGRLHFLESDEFKHLLPDGCIEITDEEAASMQKPTADQAKVVKWIAIKAERDRRTESGGYQVDGKWFHSDAKSRSQQQDNEAAGADLVPVPWKTMDGSFVEMTAELAIRIRAARMASDRAIFDAAEAHRVAMEASEDPAGYDFSGCWPPCYAE